MSTGGLISSRQIPGVHYFIYYIGYLSFSWEVGKFVGWNFSEENEKIPLKKKKIEYESFSDNISF